MTFDEKIQDLTINADVIAGFQKLMALANDAEILDTHIDNQAAENTIKLVRLAYTYRNNIPEDF